MSVGGVIAPLSGRVECGDGEYSSAPRPDWRPVPNRPDDGVACSDPTSSDVAPIQSTPAMFKRWTMTELLSEPDDFEWLVRGMLADPTYGQIAGEMKTLKTYLAAAMQIGAASGEPIFGTFQPTSPRPVLAYVGEGGRKPYMRRLRRIAESMGVNLADIDLQIVTDVAPIQSAIFTESLERDLTEVQPAIVFLDPLYAYHGATIKASDLHQEGSLLTGLSNRCVDAGASLLVVNHMNQTGTGMNLKRITMAGSGEWVDSWMLAAHRERPDVDAGRFQLRIEIGSRQWGGNTWDLDVCIGHFDPEHGSHDGPITWNISRSNGQQHPAGDQVGNRKTDQARTAILDALNDCPWKYTKTELRQVVSGSRAAFDTAFNDLADNHQIHHQMHGRPESGTTKTRPLWAINTNPDQPPSPGWQEGNE